MPYIKDERRQLMFNGMMTADNPGDLNFALTWVIMEYTKEHGLKYQTINDVIGALEGAKMEFYRRVAAPYEDTKIAENGDVYPEEFV